jgi:membrane-associated phospholipid phosphatase
MSQASTSTPAASGNAAANASPRARPEVAGRRQPIMPQNRPRRHAAGKSGSGSGLGSQKSAYVVGAGDGPNWTRVRRARRIATIVALAAAFATARPAAAAPRLDDPDAIYDVSLPIDGAVIVASGAGIIVPYSLTSRLIHPSCPCAPSSVNAFDRGVIGNDSDTASWISDVTVGLAMVAPPVADWLALRRPRLLLDDLVVFTESLTMNGALVTLAKFTVQRPIPRVYSDPALVDDPRSYRSFYSGHTSLIFAALSTTSVTLNARYGLTWQPWAATLVIGASVAAERVLAGYHFYTDVLVGAAAGTAVGTLVGVVHLRARHLRFSAFRPAAGVGAGIAMGGAI